MYTSVRHKCLLLLFILILLALLINNEVEAKKKKRCKSFACKQTNKAKTKAKVAPAKAKAKVKEASEKAKAKVKEEAKKEAKKLLEKAVDKAFEKLKRKRLGRDGKGGESFADHFGADSWKTTLQKSKNGLLFQKGSGSKVKITGDAAYIKSLRFKNNYKPTLCFYGTRSYLLCPQKQIDRSSLDRCCSDTRGHKYCCTKGKFNIEYEDAKKRLEDKHKHKQKPMTAPVVTKCKGNNNIYSHSKGPKSFKMINAQNWKSILNASAAGHITKIKGAAAYIQSQRFRNDTKPSLCYRDDGQDEDGSAYNFFVCPSQDVDNSTKGYCCNAYGNGCVQYCCTQEQYRGGNAVLVLPSLVFVSISTVVAMYLPTS